MAKSLLKSLQIGKYLFILYVVSTYAMHLALNLAVMKQTETQHHNKETFLYVFSKALERASYYGIRTLIVIYMVSETLNMEQSEALSIYAYFTALIMVSRIAGGTIGDLAIGNRNSIIVGGMIQAVGCFTLCIPSTAGLYSGLALIVIGGGLYSPNITANYGKLYLKKLKLLDAAFALDYLAINLGAFSGIVLISYYGEEYSWNTGFTIAGILMLASTTIVMMSNKNVNTEVSNSGFSMSQRVMNILFSSLLVAFFWATYEISNIQLSSIHSRLSEASELIMSETIWASFQSMISLPILIFVITLWTFLYSSYQFKLMLGFLFGAISYGILLYLPELPNDQHIAFYLLSLLLLGLSEVHIAPIISSVVTKYSNPKYLAIIFGLVFIPSRILPIMFGAFNEYFYRNPSQALVLGIIIMILISVGLVFFNLVHKNKS